MGRCPECGAWNSLIETVEERESQVGSPLLSSLGFTSEPQPLAKISADGFQRTMIPFTEFNRVMGGGIVPGSVTLVGGDPGIGKSTLLLQVAGLLTEQMGAILYVSGEESAQQIKLRADRLNLNSENLYILSETNLGLILNHLERLKPRAAIIDSIQTVYLEELTSAAGSVSQVRDCATALLRVAKSSQMPIFLVGHVTKEGAIAGPRVLEHIVDTVLYLEGERFQSYRLLRSVKNRYGSTNEVGVFEMRNEGMVEVSNPSEAFLAERNPGAPGSAIVVTLEGTRPLLVEVQALSSVTVFGLPRRTANGVDFNRLLLTTAVLSRRVGLNLSNQDIFVNVVGGLKIEEPAADLGVALAVASSFKEVPVYADLVAVGEIGLSGELRSVSQLDKRLNEAARLGFKRCLVPKAAGRRASQMPPGIEILPVRSVMEALETGLAR